jgi:hypothetical protein
MYASLERSAGGRLSSLQRSSGDIITQIDNKVKHLPIPEGLPKIKRSPTLEKLGLKEKPEMITMLAHKYT